MGRSKGIFALFALLVVIGVSGLVHFSQNLFHSSENVRIVDVVGLSGGGAARGAAIFGIILALTGRIMPREDKKPPEKQPPPP
jgi:hypothetical protein